jgi:uncharacterized protein (DUF305 family)
MSGMGGMAGMTGNADQDFLRMMSDHHKGLVAMAHLSAEGEKKGSAGVQGDAKKERIDQSLPKMQRADLKAMAERMKRDQTSEIAAFQRKASGG